MKDTPKKEFEHLWPITEPLYRAIFLSKKYGELSKSFLAHNSKAADLYARRLAKRHNQKIKGKVTYAD